MDSSRSSLDRGGPAGGVRPRGRPTSPPALPASTPAGRVVLAANVLGLASFWQQVPSWLLSTVFHLSFILILASYTVVGGLKSQPGTLASVTQGDGDGDGQALDDTSPDAPVESPPADNKLNDVLQPTAADAFASGPSNPQAALIPTAPDVASPLSAMSVPVGTNGDLLGGVGESIKGSLQSRLSATSRAELVARDGGTPQSEAAVEQALQWLGEHQNSDGSWDFDHQKAPGCRGRCGDPGQNQFGQVAPTALGLLPFLGAGETHRQGRYKQNVDRALKYLDAVMRTHNKKQETCGAYGHGLAAIALCEAYGMTRDDALLDSAQKSIDFIVFAQDPAGGGWRYNPRQPGDTSVLGWQMMALKSASMAYLKVPYYTFYKAGHFLDSVQENDGSEYCYLASRQVTGPATSAIGLLCRMYMGWKHDRPALVRGVAILSKNGPSLDKSGNNLYYNYYAAQVLHHYGGYEWTNWNAAMREYLIETQSTKGHQAGSWFLEGVDRGSKFGGRLYCTAMSTMILEVYYRHLPLYSELSTKDQFK